MVKKLKAPKTVLKTMPKKTATTAKTRGGTLRRETPSSDDLKIRIKFEVGLTDGDFGVLPGEDVEAPEAAPYRIFPTKTLETLADGVLKNLRKREGSIVSAAPGTGARTATLVAADRQVLKRNAGIVMIAAPAGLVQHWRHVLKTLNATFSVHKAVPAKWVNRVPVIVVPFADFWKDAELLCREVKPKILIVDGALGLAANAFDWDDVMPFALSGIPVVALDTAGGFERAPADAGVRMLKAVAPKVKLQMLSETPEGREADGEAFEAASHGCGEVLPHPGGLGRDDASDLGARSRRDAGLRADVCGTHHIARDAHPQRSRTEEAGEGRSGLALRRWRAFRCDGRRPSSAFQNAQHPEGEAPRRTPR